MPQDKFAKRLIQNQAEESARCDVMRLLQQAPIACSRRVLAMKNAETSWVEVLAYALVAEAHGQVCH